MLDSYYLKITGGGSSQLQFFTYRITVSHQSDVVMKQSK